MRVLLCDDEPDVRYLFRSVFELHGAQVEETDDGHACIAAVERERPGLVVLDVTLPDRDGVAVLAELRQRWPDLPVALVSAHVRPDVWAEAERLGAACHDKIAFINRIPSLMTLPAAEP